MAKRSAAFMSSEYPSMRQIAQAMERLAPPELSEDTFRNLTSIPYSDKTIISSILYRIERIEDYLRMSSIDEEDEVFDFDSEDFDGLKALQRMNREADEAIARASVVMEDTRHFIESRKIKLSP